MIRKGVIFGGGLGTRLRPMTLAVTKHLLAVYDKPMIYYPLSTLVELGVRQIALITHPEDYDAYFRVLGRGERFGAEINYIIQQGRQSFSENILLCEDFVGDASFCVILGDNFFHVADFCQVAQEAIKRLQGSVIFTTAVDNPDQFGILECDANDNPIRIVEKPGHQLPNLGVTGLYFFTKHIFPLCRRKLKANVTDINNHFLQQNLLSHVRLPGKWFDLGTAEYLFYASEYIKNTQNTIDCMLGSPECIALQKKYIDVKTFNKSLELFEHCTYGKILLEFLQNQ